MKGTAGFPVRLHYTKRGKVRWISHRDVARAFERAFRIAQLPLAFTEGFSPRPKVSFGLALSTGYESDAEYLDLELRSTVECDELPGPLTDALPVGIDVVGAAPLVERAPALMDAVTAVVWEVTVGAADDDMSPLAPGVLLSAVDTGLAHPHLEVARHRKGRDVVEDVRSVIERIDVQTNDVCVMTLRTQPRSAKPSDVLAGIASAAGVANGLAEAHVLRTHQWIERDGARLEPLRADTRPRADAARETSKGTFDVRRDDDPGDHALVGAGLHTGRERDD